MSALPQRDKWTVEEYLAFEDSADVRHEYLNGDILSFAGATEQHNQVALNLSTELNIQMRERPCRVFQSDMRVRVTKSAYFYPDVVALCGKPQYTNETRNTLLNPMVIIEVSSPSTGKFDRGDKFSYYREIPSLVDYLLVYQDRMHIEHYTRQGDTWVLRDFRQAEDVVTLASIDCTLALSDVYRKVSFDE